MELVVTVRTMAGSGTIAGGVEGKADGHGVPQGNH
jgi:hypothetical protein